MKRSLQDFVQGVPPQRGNGGRYLKAEGAFKDAVEQPRTQLDKTTAAAKLILEEEARERAAKGERLKASRAARDAAVDDGG